MNKKGFTLVELLGVVVVLAIALVIAVPSIVSTFRRTSQNDYDTYLDHLFMASETYIESNRNYFEQLKTTGGKAFLSIDFLENEGLIRQRAINPETNEVIDGSYSVVAERNSDGIIEYSLIESRTDLNQYVQNGLILHYDALNNAGRGYRRSHYMTDLSGSNNDVAGINSENWTLNSLSFSSPSDIVESSRNLESALLGNNFTIQIVFKQTTTASSSIGIENLAHLELSSSNPRWRYHSSGTTNDYTASYTRGNIYTATLANNGGSNSSVIYLNTNSRSFSNSASSSGSAKFQFGIDGGAHLVGEIYAVRVYNRVLNSSEVSNNYFIDRNRFEF